MGEALWIDLREWIKGNLYNALGPDSTADRLTINGVHLTDVDGPTEWSMKRDTYAAPFALLRDGPVDGQSTMIVRNTLQQRRTYRATLLMVCAGPAPQVENDARILTERAYNEIRTWPPQLHQLEASAAGERIDGLQIGRLMVSTFPPVDNTFWSVGYIPLTFTTETGNP
jgi:hypothetical protein